MLMGFSFGFRSLRVYRSFWQEVSAARHLPPFIWFELQQLLQVWLLGSKQGDNISTWFDQNEFC